jgi:hypothetical protein
LRNIGKGKKITKLAILLSDLASPNLLFRRQNGQNDRELSVYYYCACAAILPTLMEHGNLGTPSGNHPNNSERMTDDHVCITGNLRTAHGDQGAPGYDF